MLFTGVAALADYVVYTAVTLPKITVPCEPNVFLQTTETKQSATQSGRHKVTLVDGSNRTQAVRMWRDDGQSITRVLWHKQGTYSMGVGSTKMLTNHTYTVLGRGNTDNPGAVEITGSVDADGGAPI